MKFFYFLVYLFSASCLFGQSDSLYTLEYLSKSTRFAWMTYGGDFNYSSGGTSQILVSGTKQNLSFGSTILPRLTIGGIHFWGHADFYVTFPLSFLTLQSVPEGLENLDVYQGVETGARIYPIKLESGKVSPFIGISFRRIRYSQESEESTFRNGVPGHGRFIHPVQFGITYTSPKWHITASGYYNHQNEFSYYISPNELASVMLNPLSVNVSFLRYIDTDGGLRSERAVRQVNRNYQTLKNNNLLSAWFFGIGPSSALQMSKSPYLKENFAYFYDEYLASVFPDLSFGRYFHKLDFNVNFSYRTYGDQYQGFDSEIFTRRHSLGIESVKYLFNYLGFAPYVGPILSYEMLRTSVNGTNYQENKPALGITFGWDIRVTESSTGLLRTNLRYYPNLSMSIDGSKMMYNHLEFNFIQWVQFIGRKKALQRKS